MIWQVLFRGKAMDGMQGITSGVDALIGRIAKAEAEAEKAYSAAMEVLDTETRNEQRLKSIQHRMDEAEGRQEAAARDMQEMRLSILEQETRMKTAMALVKLFGSVITAVSILIQIGRAVLL